MTRFAKRVDENQKEIVEQLRKLGFDVKVTSGMGQGFVDLLVRNRKKGIGVELKVKGKIKQLTGPEVIMRDWLVSCGFRYIVCDTIEQILFELEPKRPMKST